MDLSVTIDDRELRAAFAKAPGLVKREVQGWIETTAAMVERHAKTREVPVVKGQLQNSISQTIRPFHAIVKPRTVYMHWVHDGAKSPHAPRTHRNSSYQGNPFMTRTHRAIKPQADRLASRALDNIVRGI